MHLIYYCQFIVYSVCINIFYVFIALSYYTGQLTSYFDGEIQQRYDYVIVGTGTAGSLIAHRLARDTNYTFLILEAGGHGNPVLDIPVLGPLLHGSRFDWGFQTVEQIGACGAMVDRKCRLPQGRMVGGSSKLNNMVHVRGNTSQYVQWFHDKYPLSHIEKQLEYIEHNILNLDELKYKSDLADVVMDAAKELGYNNLHGDVNSIEFGIGFSKSKLSQRNGERWDLSKHIKDNFNLVTNALVQNVIINSRNVAVGVNFIKSGSLFNVKANKGVILAAGALNSPKILQLSGIGPRELLEQFNITVNKDLPVGNNLLDHVTTGLDLIQFDKELNLAASDMLSFSNLLDYTVKSSGPFTSPGCEVVGFLSTNNDSVPDIQFMVLPVGITSDRGSHLRTVLGIKDEVWTKYFVPSFPKQTASILPILLNPKSQGNVYIKSSDPNELQNVDTNYLTSKKDLKTLVEGLKLLNKFIGTKAFKKLGARFNPTHFPGCENYQIFSDEYWQCYVKELTLTSYHPVGTCSMGMPDAPDSVVDTSFRVIGVDNLYVVDGSVLPSLPQGNINAAIALVANLFFEDVIKNVTKKLYYCHFMDFFYEFYCDKCF